MTSLPLLSMIPVQSILGKNMTQYTREQIKELAQNQIITVIFTKKDGTERTMNCTLNESSIPTEHRPKNSSTTARNDNTLAVFDTDKQGWRSFTIADVKHVQ